MITPFAPWKGGVYERLVGLTKTAFKKATGRKLLTVQELLTLLTEIEAVLNSRPISYIYSDIDSDEVLRPCDLLQPSGEIGMPDFNEDPDDPEYLPRLSASDKLLKFWKSSLVHLDKFWSLWHDEYLPSLRERTQTELKQPRVTAKDVPKNGDVVLIHQENVPRGGWKYGRIQELIQSRDGKIRSAKVMLQSRSVLLKPINRLYPIEVSSTTMEEIEMVDLSPKPLETSSKALKDSDQFSKTPNYELKL